MSTKRKTTEEFIEEARKIHGDKYNYSKVEYVNQLTKVCIICPIHGEFWQAPKQHLRGQGCQKCGLFRNKKHNIGTKPRGKKYTQKEFIDKLQEIYGDLYDYSKVEYRNRSSKIILICKKHGEFTKSATDLINKKTGCPFCNIEKKAERYRLGEDNFIKKANDIFHGLYDYKNVVYVNNTTKVEILCKKHGSFLCTPHNHLKGRGCPICKSESYVYEDRLYNFLKTIFNEKEIIRQYKDGWLTNNKSLDFFIPKYKLCIEHQGSQHYYLTRYEGDNNDKLKKRIQNDIDKYNECISNGVNILYFTYELNKIPNNCFHELIINENELKEKITKLIN